MTSLISIAATADRPVVIATLTDRGYQLTEVWSLVGERWQLQDPADAQDGEETLPSWGLADRFAGSGWTVHAAAHLGFVTGVDGIESLEPGAIIRPDGERALFTWDGRDTFSLDPTDTNDGRFPSDIDCTLLWEVIWRPSLAS